jgi:cobyrinic acid a,c-diamide synthase
MAPSRLRQLAAPHSQDADLLLIEGAMGLFDGAADGRGSTGDLAAALGLPVVLVVDCARIGQSVAALVEGFVRHRADVTIAGLILNRIGSARHAEMLSEALKPIGLPILGSLARETALAIPERHLGLVLPQSMTDAETLIARAASAVGKALDFKALLEIARPIPTGTRSRSLPPFGQRIAIAQDPAFAFIYEHWLADWREAGAELSFFSPLADESPRADADAIFLPGGYPELHAGVLATAAQFRKAMQSAAQRGALIYGECGGYMVLGRALTDASGSTHEMLGLLPHDIRIDAPRRTLGYRRLTHSGPLPWPKNLTGHEFHYSSESGPASQPLFAAANARHEQLAPMGAIAGRICGSYAHVIDAA